MKKVYILIGTILIGLCGGVSAQTTFEKSYGGSSNDSGRDFEVTPDGGFLIAGNTYSSGAGWSDVYLVRTDANGNKLWTKTIGGAGDDMAWSIVKTADGNYAIAGSTLSMGAGSEDFYLLKIDPDGNKLWEKTYGTSGQDIAREVQETSDGGFILVGYTQSNAYDAMLVKTDAAGNEQWRKTYGGGLYEAGYSVKQAADGYMMLGTTMTYGMGAGDAWIVKTDLAGTMLWNKTFGGTAEEEGQYIEKTTDGNYVIACDAQSNSMGDYDIAITKIDPAGNLIWSKMFGAQMKDVVKMVKNTSDGGLMITGISRSFEPHPDFWLIRLNAAGSKVWDKTYGGINHEHAYVTRELVDGSFASVGHTQSMGAGMDDVYFIKVTSTGALSDFITLSNSANGTIQVYPNPTTGKVFVSTGEVMKNCIIAVTNISGQTVFSCAADNVTEKEIDLAGLAKGIYFLRVGSDRGDQTTKLLID